MIKARKELMYWPIIFLFFWVFYIFTILKLSPVSFQMSDLIFGADTRSALYLLNNFEITNDLIKHPLFYYLTIVLSRIVVAITQKPNEFALIIVLASYSAINNILMWILINRNICSLYYRFLIQSLYVFSFSTLIIFSIPETYSLSLVFIILMLIHADNDKNNYNNLHSLITGLIAGLAATSNPPLITLILIPLIAGIARKKFSSLIAYGLVSGLTSLAIYMLPMSIINFLGINPITYSSDYLSKWGSIGNLIDFDNYKNVFINFFFYSIINPNGEIFSNYSITDFYYLGHPIRFIVFVLLVALYILLIINLIKKRSTITLSLLAWSSLIFLFYVYFNPVEAILYSVQIVPIFTYQLSRLINDVQKKTKIILTVVLPILVAALIFVNVTPIFKILE